MIENSHRNSGYIFENRISFIDGEIHRKTVHTPLGYTKKAKKRLKYLRFSNPLVLCALPLIITPELREKVVRHLTRDMVCVIL